MPEAAGHLVLCNGAQIPELRDDSMHTSSLDYRHADDSVKLSFPGFSGDVFHLPDRILDLLEIAGYVYCADRLTSRGDKDQIDYRGWSRTFHYAIRVRDFEFWDSVKRSLSEALCFMSGDNDYRFTFQPGHSTPPTSLFDTPDQDLVPKDNASVILFSGGLDSLTGALDRLASTQDQLYLVSHKSGQPSTIRTQKGLFDALAERYPGRLQHYSFYCSLHGIRAPEETQRTRVFLYCAIAYALAHYFGRKSLYVYENGITSLNFPKREDQKNARATRTTHPKTIALLQSFFTQVEGSRISIETPFMWHTKTDVLVRLSELDGKDLLPSSVSCSKTFLNVTPSTHCGGCSQCIDRRFAAYASGLHDWDNVGLYSTDFISQSIEDGEVRTTVLDYIRQARSFATWNSDAFGINTLNSLVDVVDCVGARTEPEAVEKLWELCNRHGKQVLGAMQRMREMHDDLSVTPQPRSLLHMIGDREYLKPPVERLMQDISVRLSKSVPLAFQTNPPVNENDFNDKLSALLASDKHELEREHPAIAFALAKTVPDHSLSQYDLLIESKYLRKSTTPSKATDTMAADFFKYPKGMHVLYVVYDPERSISDDLAFSKPFEDRHGRQITREGYCKVCIIG